MAQRTFTFMVPELAEQLSAARGAAGRSTFCPSGDLAERKPAAQRDRGVPPAGGACVGPSAGGSREHRPMAPPDVPHAKPELRALRWSLARRGGVCHGSRRGGPSLATCLPVRRGVSGQPKRSSSECPHHSASGLEEAPSHLQGFPEDTTAGDPAAGSPRSQTAGGPESHPPPRPTGGAPCLRSNPASRPPPTHRPRPALTFVAPVDAGDLDLLRGDVLLHKVLALKPVPQRGLAGVPVPADHDLH